MTLMLIFSPKVLKKCHVLGANYFAMKTFPKSFVEIIKLASYLSIGVFFEKLNIEYHKRKKVSLEFHSQVVVFCIVCVNPKNVSLR